MKCSSSRFLDLGDDTSLLGPGGGFGNVNGGGRVYHALRQGLSGDCAHGSR